MVTTLASPSIPSAPQLEPHGSPQRHTSRHNSPPDKRGVTFRPWRRRWRCGPCCERPYLPGRPSLSVEEVDDREVLRKCCTRDEDCVILGLCEGLDIRLSKCLSPLTQQREIAFTWKVLTMLSSGDSRKVLPVTTPALLIRMSTCGMPGMCKAQVWGFKETVLINHY